jgi:hypothetical protein
MAIDSAQPAEVLHRMWRKLRPRKRHNVLVRELNSRLWIIYSKENPTRCCYESREAALRAMELTESDRSTLQEAAERLGQGTGTITYQEVIAAIAMKRSLARRTKESH